ncbi:MAG: hypothetical protein KJZ86_12985 [Caldilineaceae bacterium]|nr:hypothetical protein [Caldilineaceae bacterium]
MSSQDSSARPKPGSRIPLPANFPVVWENPADAKHMWTLDRVHGGEVVSALTVSLSRAVLTTSFSQAAAQYAIPIRMETRHINGYSFGTVVPVSMPPLLVQRLMSGLQQIAPDFVDRMMSKGMAKGNAETQARLQKAADGLQERWDSYWLPAIQREIAFWEGIDLQKADSAALLVYLNASLPRAAAIWAIHFEIVFPVGLAIVRFDDLYQQLFPNSGSLDGQRLLLGIDNSFLAGDRALWALSRRAAEQPEVQAALLASDLARIPQRLAATETGRAFWTEIEAYLTQYGRRGQKTDGFREDSWVENPTPALLLLRAYLRHPDKNPVTQQENLRRQQEEALAGARLHLAGRDQATRAQFEAYLLSAYAGMFLHEEHNFWIDQRTMYELRRLVLACGRSLAKDGAIGSPDDIWHMTLEEMQAALAGQPAKGLQARIDQRKETLEHFRTVEPPQAIGTIPLLAPPKDNPMLATLAKMDGIDRSGEKSAANELLGNAGSTGTVQGRARVILDLADAHQLQQGEILVARTTMPPWTPLFGVAAGLVTETGGMLSHAAVVAREYGIPAVVGVADATVRIRTGQMIEVDGSAGRVRLL